MRPDSETNAVAPTTVQSAAPSLKRTLAALTSTVAGLAVGISVVLVVLTTHLGRLSKELVGAIESVQLLEETQTKLLLHTRVNGAQARLEIEGDIRARMQQERRYVTSDLEKRALAEAEQALDRYLSASKAGQPGDLTPLLQDAYVTTEALVGLNVQQSLEAQARAARWERLAGLLGSGTIVVLLLVVGVALWWLQVRAFRPVLEMTSAIERFSAGDRAVRAPENGPPELRDAARRFNEMAAELARQREQQMAFLGGVAHDLRNPISTLKVAAYVLTPDQAPMTEERLATTAAVMRRQVERLDRMVGDLLDTVRIEAGQLELKLEERDLRDLAREAAELFGSTASTHHISVFAPDQPVLVRCDPLRLEQVINNLVSNAIKYSPQGGPIGIVVESRNGRGAVGVSDRGLGIPDSERQRLFEPFRRGAKATSSSIPGAGLGLFVARRIAEAHGGGLEVQSVEGAGSTFTLLLPLAEARDRRAG